ncbi:MAG: hypothetical protein ACRDF6_11575 [bacterium]
MKRAILTLAAAAALTIGTALPVASSGLTEVVLTCDDGTGFSSTVDAETLAGLADAVQAMTLYPAGLTCTLAQAPVLQALGGVAAAHEGGGFIVGGGRFQVGCPNIPLLTFWVNFAVSAHTETDAAGAVRGGTYNRTIPAGQCVDQGHVTSKPTCLVIDSEGTPPPEGAWYAYIRSQVTQATGFFADLDGDDIGSGWKDTGNPGHQTTNDRQADSSFTTCPVAGLPHPDDPLISHAIVNGNVTIHPAQ